MRGVDKFAEAHSDPEGLTVILLSVPWKGAQADQVVVFESQMLSGASADASI